MRGRLVRLGFMKNVEITVDCIDIQRKPRVDPVNPSSELSYWSSAEKRATEIGISCAPRGTCRCGRHGLWALREQRTGINVAPPQLSTKVSSFKTVFRLST